jgi:hypothetical protein
VVMKEFFAIQRICSFCVLKSILFFQIDGVQRAVVVEVVFSSQGW